MRSEEDGLFGNVSLVVYKVLLSCLVATSLLVLPCPALPCLSALSAVACTRTLRFVVLRSPENYKGFRVI